jgi:hypothetical protein
MPRPTSIPKPRLRKGAKTYEIRVRVPEAARGGRFRGTHTTRTLSTPERKADNEQDAYRNLPEAYDALTREFDAETESLAGDGSRAAVLDRPPSKQTASGQQQVRRELTIREICLEHVHL